MATRISVTPDKDGLIHITCGGADLELEVTPAGGGSSAAPTPKPKAGAGKDPTTGGILSLVGPNPTKGPILSLRGKSWDVPETIVRPAKDHALSVRADTIDVHALHALAKKLPGGGKHPDAPAIHIHLRD